jgi:two-component system, response regulator PdtaR
MDPRVKPAGHGSGWATAQIKSPGPPQAPEYVGALLRCLMDCARRKAVQHYTSADRGWREPLATPMTLSSVHGPLEAASPDLKGVRILVVEDCWHFGSAVKSLLQACGAGVAGPVATTAAAVRLIREQTPDVALVDLSLRGGERADFLVEQLHDRGVRVIVITGYAALALSKAAAILQKPIDEAQLLECLRLVTARKSLG